MSEEESIEVVIKQAEGDHADAWIVEIIELEDDDAGVENRMSVYGEQLDELITKLQRAQRLVRAFDAAIATDEKLETFNRTNKPMEESGKPYR